MVTLVGHSLQDGGARKGRAWGTSIDWFVINGTQMHTDKHRWFYLLKKLHLLLSQKIFKYHHSDIIYFLQAGIIGQ